MPAASETLPALEQRLTERLLASVLAVVERAVDAAPPNPQILNFPGAGIV